jgi:hypothetical protein
MTMHKFPIPIAHDPPPSQAGWRLLRSSAIFILGIALAPMLAEGCAICYAQWCQVLGNNAEARTPVLDSLHDGLESAKGSFCDAISPYFQRLPWSPKLVLSVGVILMILGMLMLKR